MRARSTVAALLLLALVSIPADAIYVRRAAARNLALGVVVLEGTVDQTALDAARADCEPGCSLYLAPGTVITGQLVVDGDLAGGLVISGPIRGPRAQWLHPIASSSGGLLTEDLTQTILITTGAPDGIVIARVEFDGQKTSQAAPSPIDCMQTGNETGVAVGTSCTFHPDRHRAIQIDAGDDHLVRDVSIHDYIGLGIRTRNSNRFEADQLEIDDMGCHATDSPCGASWASVPGLGVVFGQAGPDGLERQTNAWGVQINQGSRDAWIHDSTIGYATKMGAELYGVPGNCSTANASTSGVIQRVTSQSELAANQHCMPSLLDNVVAGVRITGEEPLDSAACISVNGQAGGAVVRGNTCDDIQGGGISVGDTGDHLVVDDNTLTDVCATQTRDCSALSLSSSVDGDDVLVSRNRIDVGNGGPERGIGIFGDATGLRVALNYVHGGAGSTIESALRVDGAATVDVRHNALAWDTDVAIAAIDINGGTVTLQADAFGDIEAGGHSVTTTRVSGTPTVDCATDLALPGCYSQFTIAYLPDTQLAGALEQTSGLGSSYIKDSIQWLIDSRDAFQLEEDTETASWPDEAHNVKFVAGVGDIVNHGGAQLVGLQRVAALYSRLNDPDYSAVPIPWVAPPGNHDFFDDPGMTGEESFRTAFPSSLMAGANTILRASSDATVSGHAFDDAQDLGIAQRFKPLNRWMQAISLPWENAGQVTTPWTDWYQDRIDDYPDDFAFLTTHEALQEGSNDDDICDLFESPDAQWIEILNDTAHTNGGLGYRATFLTASGHETEAAGWFCRAAMTNDAGDKVVRTGANWQTTNEFGLGFGDGWVITMEFDAVTNSVRGRPYSPIVPGTPAHPKLGAYASTGDPNKADTQQYDWTEALDLTTRGGETLPTISAESCAATGTSTVDCSWTTNRIATSQERHRIPGGAWSTLTSDATADLTSHSISLSGLATGTTYEVELTSTDASGRTATSIVTVATDAGDTTPVVTGLQITAFDSSSISFSFNVNEDTDGQVKCGTSTGVYTLETTLDPGPAQAFAQTLSGLSPSTTYFCAAFAIDAGLNEGTSAEIQQTTSGVSSALDLGDLVVASSRLYPWRPPQQAEITYAAAQSWTEYDATCSSPPCPSGRKSFREAPGDPMASCSPASAVNDGGEDWAAINCQINNAPASSVIWLPSGTYDMGNAAGEVIKVGSSNRVLRCQSPTSAILNAKPRQGLPDVTQGSAACSGGGFTANENCAASVWSVGRPFYGTTVDWTAGFTAGATQVTLSDASAFSIGDWVMLHVPTAITSCPLFITNPGTDTRNANNALQHKAKITNKAGSVITIDRPLAFDMADGGASCTAGGKATLFSVVEHVGLENCGVTTDASLVQDDLNNDALIAIGGGTVESWLVGNHITRAEEAVINIIYSARNWIQGNRITNFGRIDKQFQTSGISPRRGSQDNIIENNAVEDFMVFSYVIQGAEGNIAAYNYLRAGVQPHLPEPMMTVHGTYSRATLYEGNDADGTILCADQWWGFNGPRNTCFRNRVLARQTAPFITKEGMIGTNRDGSDAWSSFTGPHGSSLLNFIGNTAPYFAMSVLPGNNFPLAMSGPNDIDGGFDGQSNRSLVSSHWEKNLFRDTTTCGSKPCGWQQDSANSDTHCGTAAGPGDCTTGTDGAGSNRGGLAAPAAWSGDTIPHSFYRTCSLPPSWWCDEACSWNDVHNGIGAWGDDFSGANCKLPAQIMREGGTCTPPASVAAPGGC